MKAFAAAVNWLLTAGDAPVQYHVLRDLVGLGNEDRRLQAARQAIPDSPAVSSILAAQLPEGNWDKGGSGYVYKYTGTVWSLMLLSELGMTAADRRVRRGAEWYLSNVCHPSGGFYAAVTDRRPMPCLTGNMVRAFHRFGLGDDPRVQRAVGWILDNQRHDGGWHHFVPREPAWADQDVHSCIYGSARALWALAQVEPARLTPAIEAAIRRGAGFLLAHRLFRADHHDGRIINPEWVKLGFPLWWQYDVLLGLQILVDLGYGGDPGLEEAFSIVLGKKDETWRWRREIVHERKGQRAHADFGRRGQPSPWVTLRALLVLHRAGRLT